MKSVRHIPGKRHCFPLITISARKYLVDIALSSHHIFWSFQNCLLKRKINVLAFSEKHLEQFFNETDKIFFENGIMKRFERQPIIKIGKYIIQ